MSEVLLERPAPGVALISLNRPEAHNALNMATRRLMTEHFRAVSDDMETRAVVIAGKGKNFAVGADLKEMADKGAAEMTLLGIRRMWKVVADCPKPVIAAVQGMALGGGCEFAMHADIIVAGESAKFGQPEVKVGIMPGGGATQRLTRAVGKFRAMKMMLTGEPITAAEALSMGLASEVVPDGKVLERALEIAGQIAALSPLAVQQTKEAVLLGEDGSLDAGLTLERKMFDLLFDTEDQKEGMKAFIEKRKPEFKGK